MSAPARPHFSAPFQRGSNGKVQVVEQGSDAHVLSQQRMVVQCPLGFRLERPDFGWSWPLFRNIPIDPAPLQDALDRFVPHGKLSAEAWIDSADASTQHIRITTEVTNG